MIIQQLHRLNGINHLNLIRRGRGIIGEDRTNWILLNSLLLILTFSALFAVIYGPSSTDSYSLSVIFAF